MKPGQELVCLNKYGWQSAETLRDMVGPKYNEIVTFTGTEPNNNRFISIAEYPCEPDGTPHYWDLRWFRPVLNSDTLSDMLQELEICEVSG